MTRIQITLVLAALSALGACGDATQAVTRGDTTPLGFSALQPDHDGATSQRAMIDLLSLN